MCTIANMLQWQVCIIGRLTIALMRHTFITLPLTALYEAFLLQGFVGIIECKKKISFALKMLGNLPVIGIINICMLA